MILTGANANETLQRLGISIKKTKTNKQETQPHKAQGKPPHGHVYAVLAGSKAGEHYIHEQQVVTALRRKMMKRIHHPGRFRGRW